MHCIKRKTQAGIKWSEIQVCPASRSFSKGKTCLTKAVTANVYTRLGGGTMKTAVAFCLLLLPVVAMATPVIDWLSLHWPPFRIAEAPDKGQGHLDQMQQMLMAALPQYQHQLHYSNLARVEQALAAPTKETCIFALIYNPTRAKTMSYSIPAVMSVNVMVHVRATHPLASQWQSGPGVALAEVTADPKIHGVVEQNRGYPLLVKQFLDIPGSNLSSQSLQNVNPVELLAAKRFDYLIEFPDRVRYFQAQLSHKNDVIDLPIRGLDPLMYSYVACQASEEGRRRVSDINQALQKLRATPQYQNLMMRWLSPHRQQQLLKALPKFVADLQVPSQAHMQTQVPIAN